MKMNKGWVVLAAMAMLPWCVRADTIGYIEGGTALADDAGFKQIGFSFTVTQAISVTQLGFYGLNLGGGDLAQVTLNDVTTSTQLANSGTAFYGAFAGWQYFTLTLPVALIPGDTYQVTAPAYWTHVYNDASGFAFGPEITPVGFYKEGSSGWADTHIATTSTTSPFIAANFQYTVVAVPEPSTVLLVAMGLGLGCFVGVRRVRR